MALSMLLIIHLFIELDVNTDIVIDMAQDQTTLKAPKNEQK